MHVRVARSAAVAVMICSAAAACGGGSSASNGARVAAPSSIRNTTCNEYLAVGPDQRHAALRRLAEQMGVDWLRPAQATGGQFQDVGQLYDRHCEENVKAKFRSPVTTAQWLLIYKGGTSGSPVSTPPTPEATNLSFSFATGDGWQYHGSFLLPTVNLTLTEDISSAPPGYADINGQLSVSAVSPPAQVGTANAGRPAGPQILPAYWAAWALPMRFRNYDALDVPTAIPPSCSVYLFNSPDGRGPTPNLVDCTVNGNMTKFGAGNPRGTERVANDLIRVVNEEEPSFVVNFDSPRYDPACDIYIVSGHVRETSGFAQDCDDKNMHVSIK